MPNYVYKCQSCSQLHEMGQSYDARPIESCPHCGRKQLKRIIQPIALVFRGNGWYQTDNRKSQDRGM
jgi:putative FmdB family regulatory protein